MYYLIRGMIFEKGLKPMPNLNDFYAFKTTTSGSSSGGGKNNNSNNDNSNGSSWSTVIIVLSVIGWILFFISKLID